MSSFGHELAEAALPELRELAESRMLDTFDIYASDGFRYDDDPESPTYGEDVEDLTLLFTTPGRVKSSGVGRVTASEAGGREYVEAVRELHIPVDSPATPPNAVAFAVAVDSSSDPALMGARLRIPGHAPGSQTTARRLRIEEGLT